MDGDLVEITGRLRWGRWIPAAVLLAGAVTGFVLEGPGVGTAYLVVYAAGAVAQALVRGPRLFVSDDALVVRSRKNERRYPWSTMIDTSWGAAMYGRSGPVLRVKGGPFAVPGPNAPAAVASLFIPGREVRQRFADASEAHGVPFVTRRITNRANSRSTNHTSQSGAG